MGEYLLIGDGTRPDDSQESSTLPCVEGASLASSSSSLLSRGVRRKVHRCGSVSAWYWCLGGGGGGGGGAGMEGGASCIVHYSEGVPGLTKTGVITCGAEW